ncbi:MAG: phosphate ABC transporter ATP-binding protein [Eubacteriales bacterium]
MNIILKAVDLKKSYNGKCVLDINNLEIEMGKITAIIGPSGVGKTTLLSLINGIEKPDGGKIIFEGEEFSFANSYSKDTIKKMAMVFQKPVMFNTSVYKNIAYGLKIRGIEKEKIHARISEAASWIGISDILKQKAMTLSGGEAGRVSVARAMIIKPDLLLMDEPTANLDPANVSIIEGMVLKACKEYGATVIIVTHNMFQARRIADNIVFMLGGQVIENGPVASMFESPFDKRTQAFISGNMVY